MNLSRRHFVGALSVAAASTQLPQLLSTLLHSPAVQGLQLTIENSNTLSKHSLTQAVRAVHQQQAFADLQGNAERYTAPQGNHSTRAYRASLSEEEFLRRHWFS